MWFRLTPLSRLSNLFVKFDVTVDHIGYFFAQPRAHIYFTLTSQQKPQSLNAILDFINRHLVCRPTTKFSNAH